MTRHDRVHFHWNLNATFIYNVSVGREKAEDGMSKKLNFDSMSVDEMWQLHENLSQVLSVRLASEKRELEKRLEQLRREKEMGQAEPVDASSLKKVPRERRKYPRVYPKYRNPDEPSETWSGRGKQPRWLAVALRTGHTIEEFAIGDTDANNSSRRRAQPA
jgi:DNA-binding protein H-NS